MHDSQEGHEEEPAMKVTKKKTAMKVKKMSQQAKQLAPLTPCKAMGEEYSKLCTPAPVTKKKTEGEEDVTAGQAFERLTHNWVDSQCKAMGKEYSKLCPFDKAMCEQSLIDIWGESWGAYWNSEYWKEGSHEGHE